MWRKVFIATVQGGAILAAWVFATRVGGYGASVATLLMNAGFGIMPGATLMDSTVAKHGADCMAGAMAARAFLREMIATRSYEQLGLYVRECVRAGTFDGYEIGFFGEIARVAAGVTPLSTHYAIQDALDGDAQATVVNGMNHEPSGPGGVKRSSGQDA